MKKLVRSIRRTGQTLVRRRRHLREDVVIASFPKSGRNWLLFLIANALLAEADDDRIVTFQNIHDLIPEDDPRSGLPGDVRIAATHRPYDHRRGRVIYLIRDPRDVLESYYDYLKGRWNRPLPPIEEFVLHPRLGMPAWTRHVESWAPVRSRLIRYEDLHADGGGELRRLLVDLNLTVSDESIDAAVRRSSFDAMKEVEEKHGLPERDGADPSYTFVRRGSVGGGRQQLNARSLERVGEAGGLLLQRYGYASPRKQ